MDDERKADCRADDTVSGRHRETQQGGPDEPHTGTCGEGEVKAILHYALGLRFGKVCGQKLEKNSRKLASIFTERIVSVRN